MCIRDRYYFLKKIKVVLFCTNFFGPPKGKLPLILHECVARVQKSCYFHERGPKKMRAKCYFYFWKMIFSFTQHAFSYWFFGFIFDNFKFSRKNWCKKAKLVQESKKIVQESISGGKIWNRKSMPCSERKYIKDSKLIPSEWININYLSSQSYLFP